MKLKTQATPLVVLKFNIWVRAFGGVVWVQGGVRGVFRNKKNYAL